METVHEQVCSIIIVSPPCMTWRLGVEDSTGPSTRLSSLFVFSLFRVGRIMCCRLVFRWSVIIQYIILRKANCWSWRLDPPHPLP